MKRSPSDFGDVYVGEPPRTLGWREVREQDERRERLKVAAGMVAGVALAGLLALLGVAFYFGVGL